MNQQKPVPASRLSRLAKLATLGAQTGVQLLATRDATAAASKAAEVLGTMRGLAAKVGQMASYVEGAVPEPFRAAYENALKSLQQGTCTSDPAAVRQIIEHDLDAPLERLFGHWNDTPFASASIGQVHRAQLHDGRSVAVKVQHPGIAEAVESDLRNAGVLQTMVGTLLPKGVDTKRMFNDIRARFREELDYLNEARNQLRFSRIHAGDSSIVIPAVVDTHSSRRVLTTEFVDGIDLTSASQLPVADRAGYAATLWRFEFRGLLQGGLFNADPHPGNFVFLPGGRVAFLDFGCVQELEEPLRLASNRIHRAAIRRDEEDFSKGVASMLGTKGGTYETAILRYIRECFRPLFESPFHVTPEYVKSVVVGIRPLKSELFAKDKSFVMPPRGLALMNRLQFGFYSVLSQLDVTLDYAATESPYVAA